jgi:hypothetical protein
MGAFGSPEKFVNVFDAVDANLHGVYLVSAERNGGRVFRAEGTLGG